MTRFDDVLCNFRLELRIDTAAQSEKVDVLLEIDEPRFTRSAAVSDLYVPIRAETDIAWLGGLINYQLINHKIQHEYVTHTLTLR